MAGFGAAAQAALKNPQVMGMLESMALQAGQQAATQKVAEAGQGVPHSGASFAGGLKQMAFGPAGGDPFAIAKGGMQISAAAADVGMSVARYTSPTGMAVAGANMAADIGLTSERTGAAARGLSDMTTDVQNAVGNIASNPLDPGSWMELGEVVASLPAKLETLGDVVAGVAQELKGFSGAMTEAAAIQDIGAVERQFQSAEATGEGVLELTKAVESMKDELQPIRDSVTNVMTAILTGLLTWAEGFVEWLKPTLEALLEIAKGVASALEDIPYLGKWFDGLRDLLDKIELNTEPKPEEDLQGLNAVLGQVMGKTGDTPPLSFDQNVSGAPATEEQRAAGVNQPGLPQMFNASQGGNGNQGGGGFGGKGFN